MRLKRSNTPRMIAAAAAAVLYVCIGMICMSTCLFTPVLSVGMYTNTRRFICDIRSMSLYTDRDQSEREANSSSTRDACCSRCSFSDSRKNRLDEQTPPRWSLERSIWLTWMSEWAAKWWRMIVVIADSSLSSKDLTLNMETCVARQSESTAFPPPTDVILTAMRERIEG